MRDLQIVVTYEVQPRDRVGILHAKTLTIDITEFVKEQSAELAESLMKIDDILDQAGVAYAGSSPDSIVKRVEWLAELFKESRDA